MPQSKGMTRNKYSIIQESSVENDRNLNHLVLKREVHWLSYLQGVGGGEGAEVKLALEKAGY